MTNLLKEAVTYRQWNMMDEYHIVNDAKEQLCFISQQFNEDMKHARRTRRGFRNFDREFLLPDFVNTFKGTVQLPMPLQRMREREEEEKEQLARESEAFEQKECEGDMATEMRRNSHDAANEENQAGNAKHNKKRTNKKKTSADKSDNNQENDIDDASDLESDEETEQQRFQRLKHMREQEQKRREAEARDRQALALSVERFTIPEVLFRPSDLGLDCGGIAEAIIESINACDATLRAAMYNNVLLVGGNAMIPGFKERIETELRKLAPTDYAVRVYMPKDPLTYIWEVSSTFLLDFAAFSYLRLTFSSKWMCVSQGAQQFAQQPGFQDSFSIDRSTWETMKKAGKDQKEIWGSRIHNVLKS